MEFSVIRQPSDYLVVVYDDQRKVLFSTFLDGPKSDTFTLPAGSYYIMYVDVQEETVTANRLIVVEDPNAFVPEGGTLIQAFRRGGRPPGRIGGIGDISVTVRVKGIGPVNATVTLQGPPGSGINDTQQTGVDGIHIWSIKDNPAGDYTLIVTFGGCSTNPPRTKTLSKNGDWSELVEFDGPC
jgi:hypothetical protein